MTMNRLPTIEPSQRPAHIRSGGRLLFAALRRKRHPHAAVAAHPSRTSATGAPVIRASASASVRNT